MRKLYTLFIIASLSLASAVAQDIGSGFIGNDYYRVRNFASDRYIYIYDNYDGSEWTRDVEDFQGIELWKDLSKTISNPATVIYITKKGNGTYNFQAQGTGVQELTGYTVHVTNRLPDGSYKVYASKDVITKYLSDDRTNDAQQGKLGTTNTKDNYRRWLVDKIDENSATNYFGIKPAIELNGKYYHPFYASFPFKTVSPNMHVYYVSKVAGSEVTLKEIGGVIPDSTAVVIECASDNPSDNRLELVQPSTGKLKNNKLDGVYFCNGERGKESVDAYKAFDASTMRVLTTANGKLIYSNNEGDLLQAKRLKKIDAVDWDSPNEDDIEVVCIPANTSFLEVVSNTPAVLDVRFEGLGVEDIIADNGEEDVQGVYSLSGTQIRTTNDVQGLPAGVYIVGGVKVVIK